MGQNRRNHAGGGRFTVGARHGNTVFHAHQLSQHLSPGNNRHQQTVRFQNFWVVGFNRRRSYHHIDFLQVFRSMPVANLSAQFDQPAGDFSFPQIGTRHPVAKIEKNFGNAAHADAADTNKMYFANFTVHK